VHGLTRADVPIASVTAQPRRAQLSDDGLGALDPQGIEILLFGEVEVQEVVRGGPALGGPAAHVLIEAPAGVGADLQKMDQRRPGLTQRHGVEVHRPGAAVKLARHADAEPRGVLEQW
jgi:hypothetical protein